MAGMGVEILLHWHSRGDGEAERKLYRGVFEGEGMKLDLSGTWNGQYMENPGTNENPQHFVTLFEISMEDVDGSVIGICKDVTRNNVIADIEGFHEKGFLSFIKKYRGMLIDRGEKSYLDPSKDHPDIHYSGNYNFEKKIFEGMWELNLVSNQKGLQDEFFDVVFTGHWDMRR